MIEKRIAINTVFLYFRMILVMGVTLFTSRIVLKELGVTDYGIYNVVGGVVAMVSFLNTALSNGYQRYFNIALGKQDNAGLQTVFSVSLTIQTALALLSVLLCETVGLWFVNTKMSIPPDRLYAANWVYQSSILIFVFVLIRVPYHAIIIAYEKMNLFAYISTVEVMLQLGAVYALSIFNADRLIIYAVLMAVIGFMVMTSYCYFALRCNRMLRSRLKVEQNSLRGMLSFSGWNVFGSIAHLLRGNGLNILLNVFFTPAINAANGFASQVSGGLTALAHNILTASRPQVIKHYAKGNIEPMLDLTYNVSRYVFCMLWLMSFPIMLKIDYIFSLWLGNETPPYTALFTVLVLCTGVIEAFAAPISTLVHATGKMRKFQIWVSVVIMSVIPIAYIFLKIGYPPESVFYISFLVGIGAQCTRLYIIKGLIPEFSYAQYWRLVLKPCCLLVLISIIIVGGSKYAFLYQLPQFVELIVLTMMTMVVVAVVGLNTDERHILLNKLNSLFPWKR